MELVRRFKLVQLVDGNGHGSTQQNNVPFLQLKSRQILSTLTKIDRLAILRLPFSCAIHSFFFAFGKNYVGLSTRYHSSDHGSF